MKNLVVVGKIGGLLCFVVCILLLTVGMYSCAQGTLNSRSMSLIARVLKGEEITREKIVHVVPEKDLLEVKMEREQSRAALKKREEELDRVQRALEAARKEVDSRLALLEAEQKKMNDQKKTMDEVVTLKADADRAKNMATVIALFDKMQTTEVTAFLEGSSLTDDDIRGILNGMKTSKSNKIVTALRNLAKFGTPDPVTGRSRIENILFGAPKIPLATDIKTEGGK